MQRNGKNGKFDVREEEERNVLYREKQGDSRQDETWKIASQK